MPRYLLVLLVTVLATVACGGSSAPSGPTASSVAAQPSDMPKGVMQCDLTGDVDHFISSEKPHDPEAAQAISDEWQQAKKAGATAAFTALYTDSAAHCDALKANGADPAAATYKLVINFVVQYKDEKSAAAAYSGQEPIFTFNSNEFRTGGDGVVEGSKTGLSEKSITLTQPVGNQLFYIAMWQNKQFVVILVVLNVDASAARNVAVRENARIK